MDSMPNPQNMTPEQLRDLIQGPGDEWTCVCRTAPRGRASQLTVCLLGTRCGDSARRYCRACCLGPCRCPSRSRPSSPSESPTCVPLRFVVVVCALTCLLDQSLHSRRQRGVLSAPAFPRRVHVYGPRCAGQRGAEPHSVIPSVRPYPGYSPYTQSN